MNDEPEIHEMTRYHEGQVTVWYCLLCGREVMVVESRGTFIVERGNRAVEHSGISNLIPDSAPEAQPSTSSGPDSPVADWLEADGIDIAALLDSDD